MKPHNLLFNKNYEILKVSDLGISNKLDHTMTSKAADMGTIRYMAPE